MKKWRINIFMLIICIFLLCNTISAADSSANTSNNQTPKIVILNANCLSSYYHQILTSEAKKLTESKILNVSVYAGSDLKDPSIPNEQKIPSNINLSDYDVVFAVGYTKGAPDLQSKIEEAKQRTKVIVVYPTALGPGNIDPTKYPDIFKYLENPTPKNLRNLIIYLGVKFCNLNATVEPPEIFPTIGIYHPDAPKLFTNLTEYLEWYKNQDPNYTYDTTKITVGILFYRTHILSNNTKVIDYMIKILEKKGCNVIAVFGYSQWDVHKFLARDNKSLVDVIISLAYNVQKEAENFKFLNVPVLYGVGLYYESPEQWENSKEGVFPHQVPYIALSEIYGLIEPTVIYGQVIDDKTTGAYHYEPIPYQIDYITDRAIAWAKLRKMNNSEKKIVIVYYNDGGGKANIGTEMEFYLDVPASMINLLQEMQSRGYNLGGSIPDLKNLTDLMVKCRNIGPWAPNELDTLVKTGNTILVPEETYLSWFRELPLKRQEEIIKYWGKPPGNLMVWKDSKGRKYIVIPAIRLGNIIIAPHPIRPAFAWQLYGVSVNSTFPGYQGEIPPHHQYVAFYLAMKKIFGAHALIQMWSPFAGIAGKQVGLGKNDWNGILLSDMINLRPWPLHYNPETHKRRGGFVIVSHLPPTMVPSGLYANLTTLQQKITLYKQVTEEGLLKNEYKKEIISECKRLGLDKDMNVDLSTLNDTTAFENFLEDLSAYLNEIKASYIPYGLHILGQGPTNESLVAMIEAMFGDSLRKDVSAVNTQEGLTTKLLVEVLLNGLNPEEAQKKVLGQISANVTVDLNLALNYKEMINKSAQMEISKILAALDGQYIEPGLYGDLVGHPELLPTGKNLYSFDGRLIPTKEAWNIAMKLVDELITEYRKKHGNYPKKIAFILWKSETCRHHGVMEAEILYLLGVKPVWDKYNRWTDVELIPSNKLGRPRIDVVIITSGSYRDMFGYKFELLEKAVKLAANANDSEYPNYVKEHSNKIYQWLIEKGYNSTEAFELSTARIFSHEVGRFGTGLNDVVGMDAHWRNENDIANVYISSTSYIYGKNFWSLQAKDVFRKNLEEINIGVFSTSSHVVGILDQGVDGYLGGLALAVRSISGVTPDLYINNLRDFSNPTIEPLTRTVNRELRSRYFNPKWITGMMKNGYAGARNIEEFVERIWNWNVEVPSLISENTWNQIYETYILDKYDLGLNKFFSSNNPYAKQSIVARMIDAFMKGYWNPSQKVITTLANEYINSVIRYGVTCCHHTCGYIDLNNFIVRISNMPLPSLQKFAAAFAEATGVKLSIPGISITVPGIPTTTPQPSIPGAPSQLGAPSALGRVGIGTAATRGVSPGISGPSGRVGGEIGAKGAAQASGAAGKAGITGAAAGKAYEITPVSKGIGSPSSVPFAGIVGVIILIALIAGGYLLRRPER